MQIEAALGLDDFAGTNFPRRARDDAADLRVVEIGREIERLREKAIAEQHAERISPARVHGRLRAAAFGFIHDVVVHQGGDVNQLHDHRQVHVAGGDPATGAAAQKRDERPQPFAAAADRISDVTFDRRIELRGLLDDTRFNFFQLFAHAETDLRQSSIPRG